MRTREQWLRWIARRYELSLSDAEDILQESLIRLLKAYCRHHPDASEAELEAFLDALPDNTLHLTVRRQVLNLWRSRQREQEALERWAQQEASSSDPEGEAIAHLEEQRLYQQLPAAAQAIYDLLEAGYRWDEIALQLGISASAAKMRFQRGVEEVRRNCGSGCDDLRVCGVNNSGDDTQVSSLTQTSQEGQSDETTEDAVDGRWCAVDRQSRGAAQHPRRTRRTERGGGLRWHL